MGRVRTCIQTVSGELTAVAVVKGGVRFQSVLCHLLSDLGQVSWPLCACFCICEKGRVTPPTSWDGCED